MSLEEFFIVSHKNGGLIIYKNIFLHWNWGGRDGKALGIKAGSVPSEPEGWNISLSAKGTTSIKGAGVDVASDLERRDIQITKEQITYSLFFFLDSWP